MFLIKINQMQLISNRQPEIERLQQTLKNNLRDFPIVETKVDWSAIKYDLPEKIITIKDVLNK